ncbi:MAG: redox-sensing transcriptional repressor Rex [Planctomycetaceae bacterium]|nr:redox-sensing transcriptional repressor Rex [Planctomycetaceae bacterium]
MQARNHRQQGFTLVEILIVVVILGILAAIVIPQFTNAGETAKANSLVTQLQTIRSQLELYRVQHSGNYPTLTTNWNQMTSTTDVAGTVVATGAFGPYLQQPPVNPFENSSSVSGTDAADGTAASGVGWVWISGQLKAVLTVAKAAEVGLTNTNDIETY